MNRQYLPPFLNVYQDAKKDICKWCSKNIECLSSEKLANYVKGELIPKLYQQQVENHDRRLTFLTLEDFKKALKISEFGVSTAHRYLKYLGFRYKKRTKSYYSDTHESEENVEARKRFVERYLKLEVRARVWVQITEEKAIEMKQQKGLLPRIDHQH